MHHAILACGHATDPEFETAGVDDCRPFEYDRRARNCASRRDDCGCVHRHNKHMAGAPQCGSPLDIHTANPGAIATGGQIRVRNKIRGRDVRFVDQPALSGRCVTDPQLVAVGTRNALPAEHGGAVGGPPQRPGHHRWCHNSKPIGCTPGRRRIIIVDTPHPRQVGTDRQVTAGCELCGSELRFVDVGIRVAAESTDPKLVVIDLDGSIPAQLWSRIRRTLDVIGELRCGLNAKRPSCAPRCRTILDVESTHPSPIAANAQTIARKKLRRGQRRLMNDLRTAAIDVIHPQFVTAGPGDRVPGQCRCGIAGRAGRQ